MASSVAPKVVTLLAGAAVAKGKAVKAGSDNNHVIAGTANTSLVIGLAQNAAAEAEDLVEVAVPGGGGKGLLGESVSEGNHLVSHTDGTLVKPNAAGDMLVAKAMQDGVAGDLIDVMVIAGQAAVAE